MQGKRRKPRSAACTACLIAGVVAPLGGLVVRPFAIVGAIVVLFSFVLASVELHGGYR